MLEFAPLAALGRISYGFYLYHALLTDEVVNSLSFGWIDVRRMPQFESMSVLFVISAGVSAASWALIEKPAMRLRSRLIGPASQPFTRSLPTAAKRRYDRVAKISM
jgi:peptidoglycan/LPS O-acetylase OafA/YrhL